MAKSNPKVSSHFDADGFCAMLFYNIAQDSKYEIVFPDKFGDTSNMQEGDVMLDMVPNENIEGITAYDHHPQHPENPNYDLIWRPYPTAKIIFEQFKDSIPKKEWWKLGVSLAGDVAIEEMPPEVWHEHPKLLQHFKTSTYYSSYQGGKVDNTYPLVNLLSSPVNALSRLGKVEEAYNLLKFSDDPIEYRKNDIGVKARNKVRKEANRILGNCHKSVHYNLMFINYDSPYRMGGNIASKVYNMKCHRFKTILAINRNDGNISMRGDLCDFYAGILREISERQDYDIQIGGHGVAQGGQMDKSKIKQLEYDLHAYMNEFSERHQLWKVLQ